MIFRVSDLDSTTTLLSSSLHIISPHMRDMVVQDLTLLPLPRLPLTIFDGVSTTGSADLNLGVVYVCDQHHKDWAEITSMGD